MNETKINNRRYRAKINDTWQYVYALNVQNAQRLLKKRGWVDGRWNCNDFQVENSKIKDKYERISFGFAM